MRDLYLKKVKRKSKFRKSASVLLVLFCWSALYGCAGNRTSHNVAEELPYSRGELLVHTSFEDQEDFNWVVEAEEPVERQTLLLNGNMELDVAKGITVWHTQKLSGNVLIEFEATVIDRGGPNDRVSDLNCFWMATDPEHPDNFFARSGWRSGIFWNYYSLNLYYVGLGGHDNTKTRFRKYNGLADPPPEIIGEYATTPFLIEPNKRCKIQIVCFEGLIRYYYNGIKLFELQEEDPYQEGYFGFRTVNNHMVIHEYKVYSLEPEAE